MILIAEDDKQIQKAYTRLLRGHELRICDDARDALALIDGGLAPDIIISDLEMPLMRGDTFCAALRERGIKTPFMLVSGSGAVEGLAKECGADAWAEKGVDPISKITRFAARETVSDGISTKIGNT